MPVLAMRFRTFCGNFDSVVRVCQTIYARNLSDVSISAPRTGDLIAMTEPIAVRPSTADMILTQLRTDIMSLHILPGAKLSEAEVAEKFNVSRQPVREALNLLSGEDLVVIEPRKATRVRRFSMQKIAAARFARRGIEIEICKTACDLWSDVHRPEFERLLSAQDHAVAAGDAKGFHQLDEDFHAMLAVTAKAPFAFDQIKIHKAHVDRICVLSLKKTAEMTDLVADHRRLFECLTTRDAQRMEAVLRVHLSRIEKTIQTVRRANADYFED